MKKISMILFAAVLFVSFTACGGGKKEEQKAPEATENAEVKEEVQEKQEAPAEITPAQALKNFEEFSKKFVDVINKMKVGDTKVIQEYSKLSNEYPQQVADMERYKVDFNKAQLKTYEDAQAFIAKALESWQKKK